MELKTGALHRTFHSFCMDCFENNTPPLLTAIEEAGARNHPPHSNKRTPPTTHKEHPVCDVPLLRGMILWQHIKSPLLFPVLIQLHGDGTICGMQLMFHVKPFHIHMSFVFLTDWKWGKCPDMSAHYYWAAQTVPPSHFSGGETSAVLL